MLALPYACWYMSNKSTRPEKIVENEVRIWCRMKGFFVHVVESKATFSKSLGRYMTGNAPVGFPDIVGIGPNSEFVAIELKARGKRATLREEQRSFLLEIIDRGGFGVCIDSSLLLEQTYMSWRALSEKKKQFLIDSLPKPPIRRPQAPLFKEA